MRATDVRLVQKVVPLHSVIQVQTSVIEPTRTIKFTSRRNTKSAFIGWGEEVEKVRSTFFAVLECGHERARA
jgi:hypothetical protein